MAEIDTQEMFSVINGYTRALNLLDDYDHQCVSRPEGNTTYSKLELSECVGIITKMKFGNASDLFGTEKEEGKLDGILAAVYQTAFGQDVYPTPEEKPIMISVVMNILGINLLRRAAFFALCSL